MLIRPDGSGTNFNEWCNYFGHSKLKLTVSSASVVRTVEIMPSPGTNYRIVKIGKQKDANDIQKKNYELWSNNKF
jgi:hypothetical protein